MKVKLKEIKIKIVTEQPNAEEELRTAIAGAGFDISELIIENLKGE